MSDQLFTGVKIRLLTIIDNYTKQSLSIGVGYSYKAVDVVNTLEKAVSSYGTPKVIKVNNGPEFISKELDSELGVVVAKYNKFADNREDDFKNKLKEYIRLRQLTIQQVEDNLLSYIILSLLIYISSIPFYYLIFSF